MQSKLYQKQGSKIFQTELGCGPGSGFYLGFTSFA